MADLPFINGRRVGGGVKILRPERLGRDRSDAERRDVDGGCDAAGFGGFIEGDRACPVAETAIGLAAELCHGDADLAGLNRPVACNALKCCGGLTRVAAIQPKALADPKRDNSNRKRPKDGCFCAVLLRAGANCGCAEPHAAQGGVFVDHVMFQRAGDVQH